MKENKENPNEEKIIGVDIGGTKISAGLVQHGKILNSIKIETPPNGNMEDVINSIITAVNFVTVDDVKSIGVGIPGLVNTDKGIVYDVHNIPSFVDVPLKGILEKRLNKTVFVNNDANCFTLGTKNYGNGKKYSNIIGLTLGTGLGGGIVINNCLYEGVGCGAGEFGFIPYKDGNLENYCSGQFFKKEYGISGEDANILAGKGDLQAIEMYKQFGNHLGEAIKIIAYAFAPEAVMLGGAISRNFSLFEKSMWNTLRRFPYKHVIDDLHIMPALNPDIAIVGAAYLINPVHK